MMDNSLYTRPQGNGIATKVHSYITRQLEQAAWQVLNTSVADWIVLRSTTLTKSVFETFERHGKLFIIRLIAYAVGMSTLRSLWQVAASLWTGASRMVSPYTSKNPSSKAAMEFERRQQHNNGIYESMPRLMPARSAKNAQIRVLHILPGKRGQEIVCHLEKLTLKKGDKYDALSYVWGEPELSHIIRVNGHVYFVSRFLWLAINHIRLETQSMIIWIDAICIDQSDIQERASQVQIMNQIYAEAQQVILWLGDNVPLGLPQTFERIKQQSELAQERDLTWKESLIEWHYGSVRAVHQLLRRLYWTRIWVIQELAVAQYITVLCGDEWLDWDDFINLITDCFLTPFQAPSDTFLYQCRTVIGVRAEHQARLDPPELDDDDPGPDDVRSLDLLSLAYDFRGRLASEPRDRVFGLLGLAQEERNLSPIKSGVLTTIKPDYVRSTQELSIELALNHIRSTKSLSVLAIAECARSKQPLAKPTSPTGIHTEHLPSWCPAIMDHEAVRRGLSWQPFWTGFPDSGEFDVTHSAAGGFKFKRMVTSCATLVEASRRQKQLDEQHSTSQSLGQRLQVDVVAELSSIIVEVEPPVQTMNGVIGSGWSMLKGAGNVTEATDLFTKRSSSSVIRSQRSLVRKAKLFCTGSEPELSADQLYYLTITGGRYRSPSESTFEWLDDLPTKPGLFETVCQEIGVNRRTFLTAAGDYGIGPAYLQVGDEVHILPGSQVPMILRDAVVAWGGVQDEMERDGHLYVGQAYIHRLMRYSGDLDADVVSGKMTLESRTLI